MRLNNINKESAKKNGCSGKNEAFPDGTLSVY